MRVFCFTPVACGVQSTAPLGFLCSPYSLATGRLVALSLYRCSWAGRMILFSPAVFCRGFREEARHLWVPSPTPAPAQPELVAKRDVALAEIKPQCLTCDLGKEELSRSGMDVGAIFEFRLFALRKVTSEFCACL